MKPIIEAKDVNFVYNPGKTNEFHALINISLNVFPEEFVIIFGPSGCGKSTLLNVFAGLEKPDSGEISVFGENLIDMTPREFATYHRNEVGMIYQQYNLITSLTVLDNVALPQMFVNVRKGRRERWSKTLLERFGILEHADKIPTELSGGQQQRIGIARAIVNNPKIVLADEPVGNLDSVSAWNVLDILADLNVKEKKTIILVTHNPEYLHYGDRIVYMKDGIITKEVVNRDKRKHIKKEGLENEFPKPSVGKSPLQQIADLMRAYRGLSPEQINILIMPYKAKIFAHHFITTRNLEETRVFEDIIQRRLLGTITKEELYEILKRASKEGGVGFDRRTAAKILRRINRVIRMAYYLYQKGRQRKGETGEHEKIAIEEKAAKITDYLLMTCYKEYYDHLDKKQITRLQQAVLDRINSNIQKFEFFSILDQAVKEGGVGLNSKTAKAVTEELELILILGFGIVQQHSRPETLQTTKIGQGESGGAKPPADAAKDRAARNLSTIPIENIDPSLGSAEDLRNLEKEVARFKEHTDKSVISKFFPHSDLVKDDKSGPGKGDNAGQEPSGGSSLQEMMAASQEREEKLKGGGKAGEQGGRDAASALPPAGGSRPEERDGAARPDKAEDSADKPEEDDKLKTNDYF